MDHTENQTDIQLFNYSEGNTILKGLLIITSYLLFFVGFMTNYKKTFINYYYRIFIFYVIIFILLYDFYKVDYFGYYSISILIYYCYCIYLYYYLSKKDY